MRKIAEWDVRMWGALCLLVISVGASVSTGALYANARTAAHKAAQAQEAGRTLRKLTDLRFCRAINQGREINNRDRETFVHSLAQSRRDLVVVKDPTLRALIVKGEAQTKHELAVRPKLKLLACVPLIAHPGGKLPPSLRTTPTTTD